MRTAKDQAEFRAGWISHIAQLAPLMLESDTTFEEWTRIRTELELKVEIAITNQKLAELIKLSGRLRHHAAR